MVKGSKRGRPSSLLSFDEEELFGEDGAEASSLLPHKSISAITSQRFEAEHRAAGKEKRLSKKSSPRGIPLVGELSNPAERLIGSPTTCSPWEEALVPGVSQPPSEPLVAIGAARARGRRQYMEDRHVIVQDLGLIDPRLAGTQYLCVLDGHGGSRCADFMAADLHPRLASDMSTTGAASADEVRTAFRRCFAASDSAFLQVAQLEALADGATALCLLLHGAVAHVANIGDTRAVLARRPEVAPTRPVVEDSYRQETARDKALGEAPQTERAMRERECEAVRLSVDHKPDQLAERSRVEARGGSVKILNGCARVVGPHCPTMLAVSRAFGDRPLKQGADGPLVSNVPHFTSVHLTRRDRFVILASDGLWDVLEDDEAVRLASEVSKKASAYGNRSSVSSTEARKLIPQAVADALLKRATELGSADNITVLVVWLEWES